MTNPSLAQYSVTAAADIVTANAEAEVAKMCMKDIKICTAQFSSGQIRSANPNNQVLGIKSLCPAFHPQQWTDPEGGSHLRFPINRLHHSSAPKLYTTLILPHNPAPQVSTITYTFAVDTLWRAAARR